MDILIIVADASRAAFGPEAAIYALAAIGLNMHFGYTGLLNFGSVDTLEAIWATVWAELIRPPGAPPAFSASDGAP